MKKFIAVFVLFACVGIHGMLLKNNAVLCQTSKLAYAEGEFCPLYPPSGFSVIDFEGEATVIMPICIAYSVMGNMWVIVPITEASSVTLETVEVAKGNNTDIYTYLNIVPVLK